MTSIPQSPVSAVESSTTAGTGTTHRLSSVRGPAVADCLAPYVGAACDCPGCRPARHVEDVCDAVPGPLRFNVDVPLLLPPRGHGPTAKPCEPLNANWRLHHYARAERVSAVRHGVLAAARTAGIPTGRHLTVTLHYAPGDNRRRDADNLVPTLKAACDALARGRRRDWIGLELVPDDTPQHMTKRMPVIHPGPGVRRLWLEIEVTRWPNS